MTKKIILLTALTLLLFAYFPNQRILSAINLNDPVLTVTVYKENGTSTLPNVEVNIYDMKKNLIQSGYTGSDGKIIFSTKNYPEGKYIVRAYNIMSAKEIQKNEIEINFTGVDISSVIKLDKR